MFYDDEAYKKWLAETAEGALEALAGPSVILTLRRRDGKIEIRHLRQVEADAILHDIAIGKRDDVEAAWVAPAEARAPLPTPVMVDD